MKVLFLTLVKITDINERNLYTDLMRKFRDEGHEVYIVTPIERRYKGKGTITKQETITLLKIRILNFQKTNILEKGISTLLIEYQFLAGIKKYFPKVHFDLVLYSTPPITFTKVIRFIKNRDNAVSYLLLKDIFPQNAVDLGMIRRGGLIHRYFRHKEKQLYRISDHIGCMSPANVSYVMRYNPEINAGKFEINPNTIEPINLFLSDKEKKSIRERFKIPDSVTAFIYGGNLGRPQGIDFLLEVLQNNINKMSVFFVIVGSGTEFFKVQSWFASNRPKNAVLLSGIPKTEFDKLIQVCDVGMIFLDRRFTIPNFPSRLLSYLEFKKPVIAATDSNTDIGEIMMENMFGLWSESGDLGKTNLNINKLKMNPILRSEMGIRGHEFMREHYCVINSYMTIINHFQNN